MCILQNGAQTTAETKVEEPADAGSALVQRISTVIQAIYAEFAPEKLDKVPALLEKYKGSEQVPELH